MICALVIGFLVLLSCAGGYVENRTSKIIELINGYSDRSQRS